MANVDSPHGLRPYGKVLHQRAYPITASYATDLFIGDPVAKVAGGTIERATAGTGNPVLGAILYFEEASGKHLNDQGYFPGGDTGTWKAIVADDPQQEFIIQEDSDSSNLALTDRGSNGDLVATGGGSTTTNLSGWEADSDSFGSTTAGDQLRLVDLLDNPNNAVGEHADWIVKINNHQNGPGIVSAGI